MNDYLNDPTTEFENVSKEEIAEVLRKQFREDKDFKELMEDVYEIVKPEWYYERGFPPHFVDQYVEDHFSGNNHTNTIYRNPNDFSSRREVARGIFHLDFMLGLARLFDYHEHERFLGRGRRGRMIAEFLEKEFGVKKS